MRRAAGNVFAAPPMEYCYECIKLMNSPKGVLVLINNYQGDRMNWDMAIMRAKSLLLRMQPGGRAVRRIRRAGIDDQHRLAVLVGPIPRALRSDRGREALV